MRIAVVSRFKLGFAGGGERWVLAVVSYLVSRGHTIDIYSPADDDIGNTPLPTGAREIAFHSLGYTALRKLGLSRFSAPFLMTPLERSYDVVYVVSFFAALQSLHGREPMVVGTHDAYIGNSPALLDRSQILPYTFLRLARKKRRVAFHSLNSLVTRALASPGVDVFEIPPLVRVPRYPIREATKFRVFHLGRIEKRRGADILVDFCSRALLLPDTEIVIAGSISPRFISEFLAVNSLPNVRYAGVVSDDEKERLLSISHICLHLSDREVHPVVPLEALAAGVPVISTWGPLERLVSSPGLRVVPRDTESVYRAVKELHAKWQRDRDSFLSLRRELRARFETEFNQQGTLQRTEKMLLDVAGLD